MSVKGRSPYCQSDFCQVVGLPIDLRADLWIHLLIRRFVLCFTIFEIYYCPIIVKFKQLK